MSTLSYTTSKIILYTASVSVRIKLVWVDKLLQLL